MDLPNINIYFSSIPECYVRYLYIYIASSIIVVSDGYPL